MTKGRLATKFVVPASAGWLLLMLVCCWRTLPAEAGTTNAAAQNPSELPKILVDNFGPGIRTQVKKAEEDAHKNPNDAIAVGRLAMVLQTYEEYELAAVVYERARRLQPNEFQWAYLLAVCQTALGKQEDAVKTLRDSLQKKPEYLPAKLRLADLLLAANDLNESRRLYEEILAKHTDTVQAHY